MHNYITLVLTKSRIMLSDRFLKWLCIFILLFFIFMAQTLTANIETTSKIPIAVVDLQHSKKSQSLVEELHNLSAINIIETTEQKGLTMLRDGFIEAVFVIPNDYEHLVEIDKTKDLITLYYLEGSSVGKVVSDLFAGKIIYDTSINKAWGIYKKQYDKLNDEEKLKQDFFFEGKSLKQEFVKGKLMNIEIIDTKLNEVKKSLNTSIIYKEMIISMIAMFLSFIILFLCSNTVLDKELGIRQRLKSAGISNKQYDMIQLGAALSITSLVVFILSAMISIFMKMNNIIHMLLIFALFELFAIIMINVFQLISHFVNKTTHMQIISSILILIMGILGVIGIISKNNLILTCIPQFIVVKGNVDLILGTPIPDIFINRVGLLVMIALIMYSMNMLTNIRRKIYEKRL